MACENTKLPKIIVCGKKSESLDNFFKDLLKNFHSYKCESLEEEDHTIQIATKYYSATAVLSLNSDENTGLLSDANEALIYFTSNLNSNNIANVKNILKDCSSPIKILACSSVAEELFENVMKLCIDADVELVDLSSESDEGDYPEKQGVERIVEILQSHTWPNRTQPQKAAELQTSDNPEPVPFEELFAKFAEMKATAEKLPAGERKAFAEGVVTAFWKAVGGPEDELFSSDDDK